MRTEHDPLDQVRRRLIENGTTEAAIKAIDGEIRGLVAAAAQFAQDNPEPDPAELWTDVLAEA
jgi:pyruvate dehydrogenase E1 component alpha subunit